MKGEVKETALDLARDFSEARVAELEALRIREMSQAERWWVDRCDTTRKLKALDKRMAELQARVDYLEDELSECEACPESLLDEHGQVKAVFCMNCWNELSLKVPKEAK